MHNQMPNAKDNSPCLKEPSGWFAAGGSFRRALATLSDGAFKLFAYICLEANRQTGSFEADQAELATAIGKSRRIVGKYVEELESKRVCTVRRGTNQYARTSFEIRDEYWPYHRTQDVEAPMAKRTMRTWMPSGAALFPSAALSEISAPEMRSWLRSFSAAASRWISCRTLC